MSIDWPKQAHLGIIGPIEEIPGPPRMLVDRYSFCHSTISGAAARSFEAAVEAVLAHQPAAPALQAVLEADPNHVGAIALKGVGSVLQGSAASLPLARAVAAQSESALRNSPKGGTESEKALVACLSLAAKGELAAAAARLEAHLAAAPQDVLAAKLAHALRFMCGDPQSMLAITSTVLPRLDPSTAGYGFILGCHAFSLEETAQFNEAEAAGRAAVELVPHDVWALHAVAHVMEMRGRSREGIAWLKPTHDLWPACNIFGGQLAWHLALFHLATGDAAGAAAVFDAHLSQPSSCDFRDLANAASLLWRLEQEGMDVGDRWDRIGQVAYERRQDTTYVFGTLHTLLALIGSRQLSAAHETVAALYRSATAADTDQAHVARDVGLNLAAVILALAEHREARVPLSSLGQRLQRIGGSVAQRDVFLRTLLLIAKDAGDEIGTANLKLLRQSQRQQDRFSALLDRRVSQSRMSVPTVALTATA